MKWLARVLGCTEGQAYSAAIVAVLATVMVAIGVPPALRDRVAPAAALGAAPAAGTAVSPTTTIAIPRFGEEPSAEPSRDASSSPVLSPPRGDGPRAPSTGTFADVASPNAIAVAEDGRVLVTSGDDVIAYDTDGSVDRRYRIGGPLGGIALIGDHELVVVSGARVLRVDLDNGRSRVVATIADVAACAPVATSQCEPGVQDHPPSPRGIAIDGRGQVLIADGGQATIWQLDPSGGQPRVWYQSLDLASGDGPTGMAVRGSAVRFTVGTSLDVNALAAGAVYELVQTADGHAGARTLVASFGRGSSPAGLAIAPSGRTYVALRGADAVAVLAPDHVEERRLTDDVDEPAGVALSPGSLFVANHSRTGKGRVVRIAIDGG